ncbi:HK97 family phage prohead protease [Aliiroseovarius crassostreae]|uniref:prohead protease/major capsid protein fusion protein n=1 Tax=Aliiroseovarius crassostreae TaxID=154981 RepID=UPI002200707C|nr:prohead protease/major capsid protein fusion protein [Aliiroseovarius crassostreae]UWQ10240.1 HK97 family phage prohead protease [Aliiroseovarius crassostreae]
METQAVLTRRAVFAPDTFNADAGTVEAVISTFAPVQRKGFMERLDPAGLDTSRLIGAPVLDGHRQGSARDVIGTITGHRMEDGKLVATIRLSGAADAAPIVERIREGTIKGVSIGYRVTRWAESTDPNSRARVRTAAAWSISEVSAVPIPADPGSQFRGESMENEDLQVENTEDKTTETRAAIRQICRSAGMTAEQADDMIDRDLSITEARAEAFEAMQRRTPARIRTAAPANDDPAVTMTRRADALYARVSGEAPTDEARPYMGETLRDMARAAVEASGQSTRGMDADTLFRAAMHTTSDFPQLLTSTGNRTLTAAYQAAQSPVKTALARRSTMADFRPGTRLKLSDIGTLEKVSESGEIKHTSRGEASESYALDTYATQFAISRKSLINDDLGAFRDWGSTAGRMAAETEANLILNLLLSNPTMGEDNKALFHADHGNLADTPLGLGDAGAGLDALSAARLALRGMKALDGKTPINATPKFLLVGPEQETIAEQLLAEIAAATVEDVNPFAKRLSLLVEPRITDNRWFVFADPATLPVLEYSYLSSAQGPQMASREGWDVLGMEFRVVLDFGCGAVDWRGAYMNAGE